jgi:hypothetical protein
MSDFSTDHPVLLDDDPASTRRIDQSAPPRRALFRLALLIAAATVCGGLLSAAFPQANPATISMALGVVVCITFARDRAQFDGILHAERFKLFRGPLAPLATLLSYVRGAAATSRSKDRTAAVMSALPSWPDFVNFADLARWKVEALADETTYDTFVRALYDLEREYRVSYDHSDDTDRRFSVLLGQILLQHMGRAGLEIVRRAPQRAGSRLPDPVDDRDFK